MSEHYEEVVEVQDAEVVDALIQMGTGQLDVSGGGTSLLVGHFEYTRPRWRPEVAYDVTGGVGHLKVCQPSLQQLLDGSPGYTWTLRFGDQVPLDLALKLGAGETHLALGGTRLRHLDAAIGSGGLMADLSGAMADLEAVSLQTGSGRTGVVFQGDYPVLATLEVSNASGVIDVALGGDYPALNRMRVNGASGDISVGLEGEYASLEKLSVNTASGSVYLNLGGRLGEASEVSINCVSGRATVVVPPEVGVAVRFSSVTGRVQAPGFRREGNRYTHEAYAEAATTVNLKVSTVSGKLILQPGNA
ncbi:MAG: toast rack family protein [Anaerolineae bacterium]